MKLCGVTMLRNEADIVESFVRHNLSFLDSLFVVDHGSSDGTGEILEALVAEGLPLEVDRDPSVGYLQSEIMTRAARHAFARHGADFVFAIDGDEFLKAPRRELLETVLATLPHGLHGAMQWQTYVPDFDRAAPASPNVLARAKRRLAEERHGLHKVIVARSFIDTPDAVIAVGNHVVLPHAAHSIAERPVKHAKISADVVALAAPSGAQRPPAHQQDRHRLAGALCRAPRQRRPGVSLARVVSRRWPAGRSRAPSACELSRPTTDCRWRPGFLPTTSRWSMTRFR